LHYDLQKKQRPAIRVYDRTLDCQNLRCLLVALFLYIMVNEFVEELRNHSPNPVITLISGQYFLAITLMVAFTGLVLAYWKLWNKIHHRITRRCLKVSGEIS